MHNNDTNKNTNQQKLLSAVELVKKFPVKAGGFSQSNLYVHALNSVSFDIYKNSTLGIVGESGCGKTTVARTILRIHEPNSGKLFFDLPDEVMEADEKPDNTNLFSYNKKQLETERSKMQYIFQDPYMALNPKMQVRDIITEPAAAAAANVIEGKKKKLTGLEKDTLAKKLLDMISLPSSALQKYPHEFSGGQRQRLSIARAISVNPKLVICDEPVSSLDVSIQSQILNLLIELQRETGLSYLFIAHNLAVVFYMSDFLAVMYAGRIVEYASSKELYKNPLHPYTFLLRSVVPEIGKDKNIFEKKSEGEFPSLIHLPKGCAFYSRCPLRSSVCTQEIPLLKQFSGSSTPHILACHNV